MPQQFITPKKPYLKLKISHFGSNIAYTLKLICKKYSILVVLFFTQSLYMTGEAVYVIFTILVVIIALAKEAMRPGLVFLSAITTFMVAGIITPEEMTSGFSNKGMLTVGLLFLVSEGVRQSGALNLLAKYLLPKKKFSYWRMLNTIMIPISFLSAFLNNTPVVIIFAPTLKKWAERMNLSPQKFLIPLSYATIFGGVCTLIGTSTNLMVHGLMLDNGFQGLEMFELSKVGLFIAAAGFIYMSMVGHHLLPSGENFNRRKDRTSTKEYLFDAVVKNRSKFIGEVIRYGRFASRKDLTIIHIERNGVKINPNEEVVILQEHDNLVLSCYDENLEELLNISGLEIHSHGNIKETLRSENVERVEVVLAPRFPGIGNTLKEFDFYNRYKASILAIHRNGANISSSLHEVRLRPGDTLVLLADEEFMETWGDSKIFFLANAKGEVERPIHTYKVGWTIAIVILMVLGATSGSLIPTINGNKLDMFFFSSIAVVMMAWLKIFPPKKYTKAISWDVLITIACAFGFSKALMNSGAADQIAQLAIQSVKNMGPLAVLAVVYLLTMLFTEFVTNAAAAAVTFPIALSAAEQLQVSPQPFFIVICIAASASFATPIGYQTNLIVQSIGNYKFRDYARVGIPMTIITFILSMIIIPIFWEF